MSLGLNDMQSAWQNLGYSGSGGSLSGSSTLLGGSQVASLQTPSSTQNAQNSLSTNASVPGINQVQLPSWLSGGSDANMQELLNTYSGISAAFDPSGQVNAINNEIGYNTSAGNQAANNAATDYSNRAAQSGASGLGAGAVKAQSLMPVLSQNAQLKTQAADTAAQAHQSAITLAAQVAGTIGNLRNSYLNTMTSYATGQQQLALSQYQAQQQVAESAQQTALGYANTNAGLYESQLSASQAANNAKQQAATSLLTAPGPSGNYTMGNNGQILSGANTYNALKNWQSAKANATNYLNGMI